MTSQRIVGAGAAAAAFLAITVIPLSSAPRAHADELDWILDLFSPADWAAPASDTGVATFDWDALFSAGPADASGLDGSLQSTAESLFGFPIDGNTYDMIHSFEQSWITSDFGQFVDNSINLLSGQFLIGNGTDGADGGTLAAAAGGNGGLWFGDGGAGGTDASGVGGVGGDGGAGGTLMGIGGAGGTGGNGVQGVDGGVGGLGGNGGAGLGTMFGEGGVGGTGGVPGQPGPTSANGGSTGTPGQPGQHGADGPPVSSS
ncbi:hypothetical protein [[Mycobacterium] zoologicum]|uniref:hypothetical protein n=1 Tax=[Mycobacterium] zoologicum TaxID=2872311 RepID=UPI00272AA80F|nr:hypothetical protein [Mycolicibacter sp. MYC101]MEB3062385.1 hypothetical protein [Mycolicibacter sp. MYC101]